MEKEEARPDLMFHGTGTVSLLHGQPWRVHSSLLLSPCFFFFLSFLLFASEVFKVANSSYQFWIH